MAGEAMDPADILKLVRRLRDKHEPRAERFRHIAMINEKFVNGDQWGATAYHQGKRQRSHDQWFDSEGVPRIWVNHLRNLEGTWTSLLVKDRQTAKAVAANDDPLATYRADLANQVIDYLMYELDTANKLHKMTSYACQHGTAGMKILYSPDVDSVTWEPCTIFDYIIDPTPDYHDAKWVIFTSHLDEDEAENIYEAKAIRSKPRVETYTNAAGEECDGVVQRELWMKPSTEHPGGLYACVLGDEVVEQMDFPYIFSRDGDGPDEAILPLVLMKVRDVRGSAYGATSLTDCIPLQRSYNECVSREVKRMRAGATVLVAPRELAKHFQLGRDAVLWFAKAQQEAARDIKFIDSAPLDPALVDMRNFFAASMPAVMGINDVTAGTKGRSLSGRAIENIVELDAQKNADAAKSLEVCVLDAWKLTLDLLRRYYTDARKMKMMHRPIADVLMFNSADIQGVDVRLEPSSEIDRLSAVKEQGQAERVQAGLAPSSTIGRAQNSAAYGMSREAAETIVSDYLAGRNVEINPGDLQMDVVLEVVAAHQAKALNDGRGNDYVALQKLQEQLKQLEQQAATTAPPEGAEPNEPPGQPAQAAQPQAAAPAAPQ